MLTGTCVGGRGLGAHGSAQTTAPLLNVTQGSARFKKLVADVVTSLPLADWEKIQGVSFCEIGGRSPYAGAYSSAGRGTIVVSGDASEAAQRAALLHEIGHAVLGHAVSTEETESAAREWARSHGAGR